MNSYKWLEINEHANPKLHTKKQILSRYIRQKVPTVSPPKIKPRTGENKYRHLRNQTYINSKTNISQKLDNNSVLLPKIYNNNKQILMTNVLRKNIMMKKVESERIKLDLSNFVKNNRHVPKRENRIINTNYRNITKNISKSFQSDIPQNDGFGVTFRFTKEFTDTLNSTIKQSKAIINNEDNPTKQLCGIIKFGEKVKEYF